MKAPPIDPDLVSWLQELHPNRVPSPEHTDREVWMAVGRQQAIRSLELARQQSPPELPEPKHQTVAGRFLHVLSRTLHP